MHKRFALVGAVGLSLFAATPAMASYTAQVQGGTLEVTGNKDSDNLALFLTSPTTLGLDVGADGTVDFSFDRSTFDAVHVDAGAGDDTVTLSNNGGGIPAERVTVDGGSGIDALIGASGADVLNVVPVNDLIDGN